jgi:phage major head subunit gpT-like protein
MSAIKLGSRAIIGEFFKTLDVDASNGWVEPLSMLFTSDQDSETYEWIGQSPAMREWVGGRNAKGFTGNGLTITNKHYEATLDVLLRELRRDKTGQVMVRIRELAMRTNSHWASLLSTLITDGESTNAYDGQFFFDTDHSEGDSGSQDNDITVDISALPVATAGTTTAPSVEEMQQSILKGVAQILSFKDNQGEPMNENGQKFLVMVPVALHYVAMNAITSPRGTGLTEQLPVGLDVTVVSNPRLTWTDKFAVFRMDGSMSPFIRQQETEVVIKAKAEGSEYEFDNDAHQYGVDTWRNVGYGYWQYACLVTMI